MPLKILWTLRDCAAAIAELPAEGPLPCRTVLVPRGAVAHALRRELVSTGRAGALAGTRFVLAGDAAAEVLHAAGVSFHPGEEALRPVRLATLLSSDLPLVHFPLDLLRSMPGWDDALARSISDLEAAGLTAAGLETFGPDGRLRDLAVLWHALDGSARNSWTVQRAYVEAAATLLRNPDTWPFQGPALAFPGLGVTAAEARFLRAIPGATIGLAPARPARQRCLDTVGALFGDEAGAAMRSAEAPRAAATERDLLASYLFEPPAVLADPRRPRSSGPDGTVNFEEHAGVDSELERTADWVARQVFDGIPLEDIAVLLPEDDPLAGLAASRLARLPWHEGLFPVHVAGGLPLTGFAAGARALAIVRALASHLPASALLEVLPALRPAEGTERRLPRGAAVAVLSSLGTVGGNPARPEGALEWLARAGARLQALADELSVERTAAAAGDADAARRAKDLERLRDDLSTIRPALEALTGVVRCAAGNGGLATLWPALREFFDQWLLQPAEGPRVSALLEESLGSVASDHACGLLTGMDALRVIEDRLLAARVPAGRFGEPAVYVGSLREAAGLAFAAVRVIGLAEGRLPPAAREDPVIPDGLRERLRNAGILVPTAADRALEHLHALDAVVRNAGSRVSLSAPRLDLERSQREPSSVFLEAAAALARPNAVTGEPCGAIPDRSALQRDGFAPSRKETDRRRRELPLDESAWHDGVARGSFAIPTRWRGIPVVDPGCAREVLAAEPGSPMDGLMGDLDCDQCVPGLSPERPISPSGIQKLLECPYGFLLRYVLGFNEPPGLPPPLEICPPAYGELFHGVAADFYREHGAAFSARKGILADWLAMGAEKANRRFQEFVQSYPLAADAVREQQRRRLGRDLRELLDFEWNSATPALRFEVEKPFGQTVPVALPSGDATLHVRGRIDRIEVHGHLSVVRDLKTGHTHPRLGREADPNPVVDVQIAVYGLVARRLAREWGIPGRIGAEYVYVGRGATVRSFRNDFHEALEPAARRWLEIAAGLLSARQFPRTPLSDDCPRCPFHPLCGTGEHERCAALLSGGGLISAFAALRTGEPAKED